MHVCVNAQTVLKTGVCICVCVCVCKHDRIHPFIKSLLTVYCCEQDGLFNRAHGQAEGSRQEAQKGLQEGRA